MITKLELDYDYGLAQAFVILYVTKYWKNDT